MNKHTPGPWEIEYDNSDHYGGGCWYEVGPARVSFEYSSSKLEEASALADANLISAAPEMLAALRASRMWLETVALGPQSETIKAIMDDAIAKADQP